MKVEVTMENHNVVSISFTQASQDEFIRLLGLHRPLVSSKKVPKSSPLKGRKMSAETRAKISKARRRTVKEKAKALKAS